MFYSDNTAAIHPEVLDALVAANAQRFDNSYGDDELSEQVRAQLCGLFGAGVAQFVGTGTGANVVALALAGASGGRVLTSSTAHLANDEAGAPERALGCQIVQLESADGKLTAEQILRVGPSDAWAPRLAVVAVSQATEHGCCYSLDELGTLARATHDMGAAFHVDGARLANACAPGAALDGVYSELFAIGVDTLTLSGTKNGAMSAEVVLARPGLVTGVAAARVARSCGNLASKSRFVAAQFAALLKGDLWLENAGWANAMATQLATRLGFLGVETLYSVQANEVFARVGAKQAAALARDHVASIWTEPDTVRFVCSWSTIYDDIDDVIGRLATS